MIVAFVYDFPHFKSAQGLFALKRRGIHDVRCVAAPKRRLPFKESPIQFRTKDMADAHHPRDAANALGYRYTVADHADVRLARGDVGLILGARVLPDAVVHSGGPIVNIHPGVLPLNRGLDTLKWAVHEDLPQAITVHAIDRRIDRGKLIFERLVNVRPDDSPADVYNRMMWAQIEAVPEAALCAEDTWLDIGKGVYRRPMTLEQDVAAQQRFDSYKHRYGAICEAYLGRRAAA